MAEVTVNIPVFDVEKYLHQCLDRIKILGISLKFNFNKTLGDI